MKDLFSPDTAVKLIRRRLTSGLLTLCLATGFVAFSATPAHAASSIAACFLPARLVNGFTIPTSVELTGMPATVEVFYLGVAYPVSVNLKLHIPGSAVGLPPGSSCLTYSVPAGLQGLEMRVVTNFSYRPASYLAEVRWRGETLWFAKAGSKAYYSLYNYALCTQGC